MGRRLNVSQNRHRYKSFRTAKNPRRPSQYKYGPPLAAAAHRVQSVAITRRPPGPGRASRWIVVVLATALSVVAPSSVATASDRSSRVTATAPATVPTCTATSLSVSANASPTGFRPTPGGAQIVVTVTNIGLASCTVGGWPSFLPTGSTAGQVPLFVQVNDSYGPDGTPVSATQILLQPAATASTALTLTSPPTSCPDPQNIGLISIGGQTAIPVTGLTAVECSGEAIYVTPLQPGTLVFPGGSSPPATVSSPCALGDLSFGIGSPIIEVGAQAVPLVITDASSSTCGLATSQPVITLTSATATLDAKYFPPPGSTAFPYLSSFTSPAAQTISLAPGEAASLLLIVPSPSGSTCASVSSFSVAFAFGSASESVAAPTGISICSSTAEAGTSPEAPPFETSLSPGATSFTNDIRPAGTASPDVGDRPAGYWYAGDESGVSPTLQSGGVWLTPYIGGTYGGYFGSVGSWDPDLVGESCPDSHDWEAPPAGNDVPDAESNAENYGDGVGAQYVFNMGGVGVDKNYNQTMSESMNWGKSQADTAVNDAANTYHSTDGFMMFMDIELGEGWDYSYAHTGCQDDIYYTLDHTGTSLGSSAQEWNRYVFDGFWDEIEDNSPYFPGVYSGNVAVNPVWTDFFGSYGTIPNTYQWTFESPYSGSLSSSTSVIGWCMSGGSPCASWFGGVNSSHELAWQFSPNNYNGGQTDFDQVYEPNFP